MEDQSQEPNSPSNGSERNEPVRSRWTPKPEQILILESIFNSGMVNPPKDETVRIRKLLEKFGSVGDANVFYWFQNRRSRSRRRQRQMQASQLEQRNQPQAAGGGGGGGGGGAIQYESSSATTTNPLALGYGVSSSFASSCPSSYLVGSSSSSSCGLTGDDHHGVDSFFPISASQIPFPEFEQSSSVTPVLCPEDTSNMHFQSGFITVFINGVPTEVHKGPIDLKTMFGQDVVLVHSSGIPIPMNEFGILMQSLQPGESYFLVTIYNAIN
ncbi:hypothetical protein FEM48_Zijuj12G0168300 [Ziziphus jujuba var. spinosa]|uniref:Homeobox domain-containing protein n=1 Tax=Ziziphus jujuba var. spinosa TaxID=714518 RepID=A0A978UEH9_ZIZJJ|nr:hypothetical protein FEM48_Zijuj12G0168300 [Ziziphus jujuba var. spinosa]